jgi:hypothetical protein
MSDPITMTANFTPAPFAAAPTAGTAAVEFFDPPMCCPTGLCGPTLDQTLLDVSEMILALQSAGLAVERYQMASAPNAFPGQRGGDAPGARAADGRPAHHRRAWPGCQDRRLPQPAPSCALI